MARPDNTKLTHTRRIGGYKHDEKIINPAPGLPRWRGDGFNTGDLMHHAKLLASSGEPATTFLNYGTDLGAPLDLLQQICEQVEFST